jgi:hypothetical protein
MKTAATFVLWTGIAFAVTSGIAWVRAALIGTPVPRAWLSGPPREVAAQIERQSWWNGVAAWLAAGAAFAQAVSTLLGNCSN